MGEILHCTVDELRTVIGGNDLHSWREARLECIELVLDRCDRFAGIFARAKNDATARHFAFAVEFGHVASHFRADLASGDVTTRHRHAPCRRPNRAHADIIDPSPRTYVVLGTTVS